MCLRTHLQTIEEKHDSLNGAYQTLDIDLHRVFVGRVYLAQVTS